MTITPGLEQQPGLQPQRALVVQQRLPPVPDDVLGDEHADDVPRRLPADGADVVEQRLGDVAVGALDHGQRHRDVAAHPVGEQPVGLGRIDPDGHRRRGRRGGSPGRTPACAASARSPAPPGRRRGCGWAGRRRPGAGRGLVVHGVVVPADAHHQQVQQRHRDHHDVGAVDELRDQHEDQHDASSPRRRRS